MTDTYEEPINRKLDKAPTEGKRAVTSDRFHEVHRLKVDVQSIASLNELADNPDATATVRLGPAFRQKFKEILVQKGFSQEEATRLANSQKKIIPTGLRLMREQNQHGVVVGVKSPQFSGEHMNGGESFIHTSLPNTPVQYFGEKGMDVFNPKRAFTDVDFNVLTKVTPSLIKSTIIDVHHEGSDYSEVQIGTDVYNFMLENWDRYPAAEREATDENEVFNPTAGIRVNVTRGIANQLRKDLTNIHSQALENCINIDDICFEVSKAGGTTFDTKTKFVGQMAGEATDEVVLNQAASIGYTFNIEFKPATE